MWKNFITLKTLYRSIVWLIGVMLLIVAFIFLYFYIQSIGCEKKSLLDSVKEYYSAESNKNWEVAYKFRTPKYREEIKFSDYEKTMGISSRGWELEGIEIADSMIIGDVAFVVIKFSESFTEQHHMNKISPNGLTIKVKTTWNCINGKWFVYDAATRGHLPYNAP